MKKIKVLPHEAIVSVETLKSKFNRLASGVGDNGLTPNFRYTIISGTYGVKSGVNPQTKQAVEYPTVRAVKIGEKSGKISGLSELSINSLKRTVNVEDSTIDVIDFSTILPNCSELNSLQILESLPSDKMFAIVPNGTVVSTTNFDSTSRPRPVYKAIELLDVAVIENVINAAKDAGLITIEEPEEETAE